MKMDVGVKELWVDALRSGEYKQAKAALHKTENGKDSFCCLGVLCDIAVKHLVIDEPILWSNRAIGVYTYDGVSILLPRRVTHWSGVSQGAESILVGMNDDDENDFEEIAKYIEGEL